MNRLIALFLMILWASTAVSADTPGRNPGCDNSPARTWWDVLHYELFINLCQAHRLQGRVIITARVIQTPADSLQLDLKQPLQIDQIVYQNRQLTYSRQGNQYYLHFPFSGNAVGDTFSFSVSYRGAPVIAEHAPWDSGLIYTTDNRGNPWWAVTCESEGAFVWFPCKNTRSDEPESVTAHYTCPSPYKVIGNGRLINQQPANGGKATTWTWAVTNPINNYDITFYLGNYVHWHDTYEGIRGPLDLDYFVLPDHLDTAKQQFKIVPSMLRCFEQKLGPYPFYKDGFKLVESPYLGMEHQSAVAYGNQFQMGYLGTDRSHTGIGLTFDFIIIHESAHEWFGNSITASDPAYGWIQEGFTTYAETIFVGCRSGKEKAFAYQRGKRENILNDQPVEGIPGACDGGSTDQYDKAAFMIHMIRILMDDDARFFDMLRAMNQKFFHALVTAPELETWMTSYTGLALEDLFTQYLRRKELPVLAFKKDASGRLMYRWEDCIEGFKMPVKFQQGADQTGWLHPTTQWQYLSQQQLKHKTQISPDFLITIRWP